MGSSNLPPGVSESSIPGNRPEDEWADKFWNAIAFPSSMHEMMDPEHAADAVNEYLRLIAVAYGLGFNDGQVEAEIDQAAMHE